MKEKELWNYSTRLEVEEMQRVACGKAGRGIRMVSRRAPRIYGRYIVPMYLCIAVCFILCGRMKKVYK